MAKATFDPYTGYYDFNPVEWAANPLPKPKRGETPIFKLPSTGSNRQLRELWIACNRLAGGSSYANVLNQTSWANKLYALTGLSAEQCLYCRRESWDNLMTEVDGYRFCTSCFPKQTFTCPLCHNLHAAGRRVVIHPRRGAGPAVRYISTQDYACGDCTRLHYIACTQCGYYCPKEEVIRPRGYGVTQGICPTCVTNNWVDCDRCGGWVPRRGHTHPCDCEPYGKEFILHSTQGEISQEEIITISLPSGIIDEVGQAGIKRQVRMYGLADPIVDEVEPVWMNKQGTFPKRLAKTLYKTLAYKAPAELLAAVGTIAQDHTAKERHHSIQFTRDLNQPASHFVNAQSCWWSNYAWSRCAFKAGGGLGMLAYKDGLAIARSWILPLDAKFNPTKDIDSPAHILFNAYGTVSGFEMARVFAYLTGNTYKKVAFPNTRTLEVNSASCILVADQDTCANTKEINVKIKMLCDARSPY